ncbi:MAG TPA: hypothetical protein PLW93_01590 [Candidatus Absconditabacterales bacterium]|nr:hypothetical protein [Candidatus Absconditabacterales bacterium]HNG96946.1 hypothetical protein [Candidatus Absconditabacterales bacterium]
MSQSYGDQTFLKAFREVAHEHGIDPNSEKGKQVKQDIHLDVLAKMDESVKDSLYQDYRQLLKSMN